MSPSQTLTNRTYLSLDVYQTWPISTRRILVNLRPLQKRSMTLLFFANCFKAASSPSTIVFAHSAFIPLAKTGLSSAAIPTHHES